MAERYPGLSPAQEAAIVAMTDQRCADLISALSFFADLPDATKTFLIEARPEEIQKLQDAMRLAVATETVSAAGRLVWQLGKWAILTAFSIIMFFTLAYDKLPAFMKGGVKQ